MAIGFREIDDIASGGAADPPSAPALPTGTQNGDMVVYGIMLKYGSGTGGVTITPPTDWLDPTDNEVTNTGLSNGSNDEGNVRAALFFREKDASWSTLPQIDLSGTPNCTMVAAISFSKGASEAWDIACASAADDSVAATGVNPAAAGTTLGFGSGDWLFSFVAQNGNAGTPTVPMTVTVAGVTLGNNTTRWDGATTSGTDLRGHSTTQTYTSGTASAGPDGNYVLTGGDTNGAGVMVFARLRVTSAPTTDAPAGLAAGVGTAFGPILAVEPTAGLAVATGTALRASVEAGEPAPPRYRTHVAPSQAAIRSAVW
jgi:hypothetical protein